MPVCYFCQAPFARCRCGQCRQVYFCNRECQIGAWPSHRPECHPTPTQSPDRITTPVPTASPATAPVTPTPAINNQVDEVASIAQSGPATPETPKKKKKKSKKAKKHAPGETPPATPQAKPMATPMTPPLHPLSAPMTPPRLPTSAPASPPHKPSPTKTKTKKNKKKSRSHSWSDDAFPSPPKTKLKSQSMGGKMVTWGYVQAREFLRCPGGGSAVPSEGAWALGLGKHVGDVSLGSVDNVVSATEKAKSNFERVARLTERERKKVLMTAEDEWQAANASLDTAPAKSTTNARQRRLSISNDDCDAHVFATLSHEQASEFALIRTSREEHCGCSCGDLVKKVSKMHIKKLVAWLHERDVDTAHMSKPELMMRAKTLAAEEKNCATEDCECARNGVPCHQDTCSGCRGNCDNHRYTYNKDHVHAYRQELIAQWTCSNQLDV
ncbi:hypothetical protein SDRG_03618 [Saprolegnia diclina VS20]|uniref:MYND-type domain-containing protein n=1 Tax=Saprolegnia diclina (strain VS20) TaxID=1156394 RepID=T0QZD3_SAPDV|nr:hypothetical protein SDRG_03618 [Saprolegnia diclina VS20]EQC39415.1 hypothetical protein SDRG_03618 [Saprolegnia diclina VS20]|eukprot:XP_008607476.1 hypothetical protein SDRG_03618 [Saprolegnia diclina VS20]